MAISRAVPGGVATALVLALCGPAFFACHQTIYATGRRPSAEVTGDGEIPAAAFFRAPLFSHVALSPDGQHVAAVAARDGSEVVVVIRPDDRATQPLAKLERENPRRSTTVRTLGWPGNDRLLVSLEMPAPFAIGVRARQTRLMTVPLDGSGPRYLGQHWRLQEWSQFQHDVVSWLPDDPEHVLLDLWMPEQIGVSVRQVDVESGAMRPVVSAMSGSLGFAADHRGQVRVGWGGWRDERVLWARIDPDDSFDEIVRFDPFDDEDHAGFAFAGFSEDPATIYVLAKSAAERDALYAYDLESKTRGALVFGRPDVDITGVRGSQQDGHLLSVSYDTERPQLHFVDEAAGKEQEQIDRALPDRTNRISSSSQDDRYALVESSGDQTPPRYYLFDRERRNLAFLFAAYPELDGAALAPMDPIQYRARDGLVIHGYLTRPRQGEAPYPTIVYPHADPWGRDVWGWDPVAQWLASRGFAVLQPNYRGSSGYGLAFREKSYGRWGLEMQDDLTDGARWLVEQGIADRHRIGIYGALYGGYAALEALVKEPELFRAGASFGGITDVPALLDNQAFYLNGLDKMEELVGSRWGDRGRLAQISPAEHAGEIRAPVLIGHGTEDPWVHVSQAYHMADAIEATGAEVELLVYEGERHGFLDERNRIDFYTKLADFFERNLAPPSAGAPAPGSS